MWRSLQKWHAWLLSPLELPYCSQSKINSFNLFQGPYLQNRDFWESILWSQETKSIISDPKASKMFWCCKRRSTVRSVWYPQWRSVVVMLFYRDEWVLKVWGSCALSTLSWIHTLLCNGIQKLETEDATLPSFPALLGIFSAWQWRYSFSQGENPSVDMYFTQS